VSLLGRQALIPLVIVDPSQTNRAPTAEQEQTDSNGLFHSLTRLYLIGNECSNNDETTGLHL
jgi:hypothetical protein